jgi:hypothetical protein
MIKKTNSLGFGEIKYTVRISIVIDMRVNNANAKSRLTVGEIFFYNNLSYGN